MSKPDLSTLVGYHASNAQVLMLQNSTAKKLIFKVSLQYCVPLRLKGAFWVLLCSMNQDEFDSWPNV